MAVTFEGKTIKALLEHMESFPEPRLISHPDVPFEPTGVEYFDVSHLPNGFAQEGLGQADTAQGILQVSVMSPKGGGVVKPHDRAGAVINHFAKGLILYGDDIKVYIPRQPTVSQTFVEDVYSRTNITIQYNVTRT